MKVLSKDEKRARILIALTLAVVVIGFCLFFFQFNDTIDSVFTYTVDAEGYATVQGYTGNPRVLKIPAELDGAPVRYIDHHAFGGHHSDLKKVVIPEGVEVIGEYAFANAPSLQTVVLPSTLEEIGRGAFSNCTMLSDITLPDGLTTLDAEVFDSCTRLKKLKIPASVREIGVDCFLSCESLRLDVSENPLAAEIAESYRIETGRVSTFSVYLALSIILSVLAVGGVFYGGRYIRQRMAASKSSKEETH